MFSKLLLLAPFAAYVNHAATDCANVITHATDACQCNSNASDKYFEINTAGTNAAGDECAKDKVCLKHDFTGAKSDHSVCMTPLTAGCASYDAKLTANANGCLCTDDATTGNHEACFGDRYMCLKTGGLGAKCLFEAKPMTIYGTDYACPTSGAVLVAPSTTLGDNRYCPGDTANAIATLAATAVCTKNGDTTKKGILGTGLCDTNGGKHVLCTASGTDDPIAKYDSICTTSEYCIRQSVTDGETGFTGYEGSPFCTATVPVDGTSTACAKAGKYIPLKGHCQADTAVFCGHGYSKATGATCDKTGTDLCQFRGQVAPAAGCICANPGDKTTASTNACKSGEYCMTTEFTTGNAKYKGDATCVTGSTSHEAVDNLFKKANGKFCKGGRGNVGQADATATEKASPCRCGNGAICGPGSYCLLGNETALADDNDTCLTGAIADCTTMDGQTATTVPCKCGVPNEIQICGATQACIYSNSTELSENGKLLRSATPIHACLNAVMGACADTTATAKATAVCFCDGRKETVCAVDEYCYLDTATNSTSCAADQPTAEPTSEPSAAASGSSPINPVIAFAVTMLSLAISALM